MMPVWLGNQLTVLRNNDFFFWYACSKREKMTTTLYTDNAMENIEER